MHTKNEGEKNIQYVIGLGDLTDQCQRKEWIEAASALEILEDAGLYYSVVRGNHDTALSGIEASSAAFLAIASVGAFFLIKAKKKRTEKADASEISE